MLNSRLRCPVCGNKLDVIQVEEILTARQRNIRDAIEIVCRDTQRETARSMDIAVRIGVSQRTVQNELRVLKRMRIVWTPNGLKSGYALKKEQVALRPASAA